VAIEDAETGASPDIRASRVLPVLIGGLLGLLIGTATSFAQIGLNGTWQALSNSASPWLTGAFVAGAIQLRRNWAIGVGLGACLLEVAAYYVITPLRGHPANYSEIIFWGVCALVGGPVFGWAGWTWRRANSSLRPIGGSFLPATFIAEAIGTYQLRLHYRGDEVLYAAIGLVLFAVVAISSLRPARALAATTAIVAIGTVVYWLCVDAAAGATFGA
jgi:hypothetical protein